MLLEIDTKELADAIAERIIERIEKINNSATEKLLTIDELAGRLQAPKG